MQRTGQEYMTKNDALTPLMRETDGSYSFTYGPFVLYSALQPIFSQANGLLDLQAFEGLVRPTRNGEPVRPAQFFPLVAPEDFPMIDSRCRTLHIANTGLLQRATSKLFVNFHPRLFLTDDAINGEVEQILAAAQASGLSAERIVCEIAQKENDSADMLMHFVGQLRSYGFKIAIDEYGAGESDITRLKALKPDYVKFEAEWVKTFMENSAGSALLRVMVGQFREEGIIAIFEGLEEIWQVDLCQDLGVTLMQGYALSQPELAPTTFNQRFPEGDSPPRFDVTPRSDHKRYNSETDMPRYSPARHRAGASRQAFGKRGR